jgi:6-pyruvoyltetrahydropterin/6-carboxytetrahydropterin synthase
VEKRVRIEVARERYKFSCAHMTLFPDGKKERLHGHNFFVSVVLELRDWSFQKIVDFGAVKAALEKLCDSWKEHTLLPGKNPQLEIVRKDKEEIEFLAARRRYVLPAEDVLVLPIDNISVEGLATLAADELTGRLREKLPAGAVKAFEVTISEAPGQGATCVVDWPNQPPK